MSEWWTYRLTSFLLFSPRTYHRLFELYNVAIWPAQLLFIAIGVAIAVLVASRYTARGRIICALLALCWLWVAEAFLYQRYAQINWIAPYFAAAFGAQALALLVFGTSADHIAFVFVRGLRGRAAVAAIGVSVLAYPLLAPLSGRAWTTAEVFGVAPDPTVLATAAAVALVRGPMRWLLLVVPLLWCLVSGGLSWAMDAPEALVIATIAAAAIILAWRSGDDATAASR